eukprot:gene31355-40741_t
MTTAESFECVQLGTFHLNSAGFKAVCDKFGGDRTARLYHLELINNQIFVTAWPTSAHEKVVGTVNSIINVNFNEGLDNPYSLSGATAWSFEEGYIVEADCSFVNEAMEPNLKPRDANGSHLPDIIVEVAVTQSYEALFHRPLIFFSDAYPGVKAVVLIKLVQCHHGVGPTMINQMVAVVFRRNVDGVPKPTIAISFGQYLHPSTRSDILLHSKIEPELFVGTGMHNVDEQCSGPGIQMFQLQVLEADRVWEHVPANQRPVVQRDVTLDLFLIRRVLVRHQLAT